LVCGREAACLRKRKKLGKSSKKGDFLLAKYLSVMFLKIWRFTDRKNLILREIYESQDGTYCPECLAGSRGCYCWRRGSKLEILTYLKENI
jgi:hypothetical protein